MPLSLYRHISSIGLSIHCRPTFVIFEFDIFEFDILFYFTICFSIAATMPYWIYPHLDETQLAIQEKSKGDWKDLTEVCFNFYIVLLLQ